MLPVHVELVVPEAAALPRFVVTLVMSEATLAKIDMVVPVTGAVRDVSVVLVWLPMLAKVLTRPAHCVAVTVLVAATVLNAVCPQPLSLEPVPQTSLMLLPEVVLTKPL
jgi:hypothetical protein